jgi:RHS repeat-associated protein
MIRLLGIIILFMLGGTSAFALSASECSQFGGQRNCSQGFQPHPTSEWEYYVHYSPTANGGSLAPFRSSSELGLKAAVEAANPVVGPNNHYNTYYSMLIISDEWAEYDTSSSAVRLRSILYPSLTQYKNVNYSWVSNTFVPSPSTSYGTMTGQRIYRERNRSDWSCPPDKEASVMRGGTLIPQMMCAEKPPKGPSCGVGNPCSVTTGNKFQAETDWTSPNGLLSVKRHYNSLYSAAESTARLPIGKAWSHGYSQRLELWKWIEEGKATYTILISGDFSGYNEGLLTRADGETLSIGFYYDDSTIAGTGSFFIQRDKGLKLTRQADGNWRLDNVKTGRKELYDIYGKLIRITERNGQYVDLTYTSTVLNGFSVFQLYKVTDSFGYSLTYSYNSQGQMSGVTLPNGKLITYTYDPQGRLSTVTRPGVGTKTYIYSENSTVAPSGNPYLLTGITDERGIRYAYFEYDSEDRGIVTKYAGEAQKYTLSHSDTSTTVVDPDGLTWTYTKAWRAGSLRITNKSRPGLQKIYEHDQGGNVTKLTEKRAGVADRVTTYTYDLSRNLETSRTEAVGTSDARKTVTEWETVLPVPKKVTEYKKDPTSANDEASAVFLPVRETTYTYDAKGNALTKTVKDLMSTKLVGGVVTPTNESRTWTYTYNQFSQKLMEKTPANETTTYTYDTINGNLLTVTNPLGQVTTYSGHNADGQPTVINYPNGHKTTITYDDMGKVVQQADTIYNPTMAAPGSTDGNGQNWVSWPQWLVDLINSWCQLLGWSSPFNSNNQTPTSTAYATLSYPAYQTATTQYVYEFGLLKKVILPDAEELVYSYDDAQRLIGVTDGYGNSTTYVLNSNGDITSTEVKDSSNTLKQKIVDVYDKLARTQTSQGQSTNSLTATSIYDEFGNLKKVVDNFTPNRTSTSDYDVLDRKVKDTDPLNNQVQYEYDVLDQLRKVTDAKNNSTEYTYNAFGEVTQQSSPDTGISTYRYDDGRLARMVDGRNKAHNYFYDNAGRMSSREDGTTTNITSYTYDQGTYGAGQLTGVSNANSEVRYSKDSAGRVLEKLVAVKPNSPLRVRYRYTAGGKLEYMILPSGRLVRYQYTNGKLTGMLVNGQFISNVAYGAYGVQGWTWGTNQGTVNYQYDLDGRPTSISASNVLGRSYVFDNGNRISSITDTLAGIGTQTYEHDTLDRLTKQILAGTTLEYAYADANSNRTSKTTTPAGGTATAIPYTIAANSNRITQEGSTSYSYTTGGQITSDGVRTYTYDNEGRSDRITKNSLSIVNTYDPLGQRIKKAVGTQFITYVYNEEGQLIGEYDTNNVMLREYIWLGDRLIGMQSSEYPNQVLRVNTDHLGTVRAVSLPNATNTVLWRWEGDQFGDVLPNEDVDANGQTLTMPLRHPGQYYDAEVGTFYNYFRDYNPATGRYVESDPIGLRGGMNTYGYVGGNPLELIDPEGLAAVCTTILHLPFYDVQMCKDDPQPTPKVPAIPKDATKDENCDEMGNCSTKYPNLKKCSSLTRFGFVFSSQRAAMLASGIQGSAPSKKDNYNTFCGADGTHTNYMPTKKTKKSRMPSFGGSISSCKCCQDTLTGPMVITLWKAN